MKTLELYVNYGVFGYEKKPFYTHGGEAGTAVCSEVLTVKIPEAAEVSESVCGDLLIDLPDCHTPWPINDVLRSSKSGRPLISWIDDHNRQRYMTLKVVEAL